MLTQTILQSLKQFIAEKYNYDLTNEEIMYLAIHINKITSDLRRK
ncbi:MAG: PRD domain-containing protein [Lactobacillus amylovorus]